jgi:uncharacterized protein
MSESRRGNGLTRRAAVALAAGAGLARGQGSGKPAHPVVHFEIGCKDKAKTGRFFSDLFGWKVDEGPAGTIDTGSAKGVPGHMTSLGHEPQHYTMFYVEVEDVKTYLDKAVALGGKVLVPAIKLPTGTFGWFADPEGNMIGLLMPA